MLMMRLRCARAAAAAGGSPAERAGLLCPCAPAGIPEFASGRGNNQIPRASRAYAARRRRRPPLGLHTSLILRKTMHQTGLFSAHGLSSAPAAQPFLRPSLALPLAAHVVYGIVAATTSSPLPHRRSP
jgi:hypothetical protein